MMNDHAQMLLSWYDKNARILPWRVMPKGQNGEKPNAYFIWLSEVMLQQTTVTAVIPYFEKFTKNWPDITSLAAASQDDVMQAWAGLGYYARARNMKKCATQIVENFGGKFPQSKAELLSLPGIGDYTAAAIMAIAFDQPAVVVDGNVERVVARLFKIKTPLPTAKPEIYAKATKLTPYDRGGDYAQAMMDLGATICTPKSPKCDLCPLNQNCMAKGSGAEQFPKRTKKKPKPHKQGVIYWLEHEGKVLLERRPDAGLLGGMLSFPTTEWQAGTDHDHHEISTASKKWQTLNQSVGHVFTHFSLELTIKCGQLSRPVKAGELWLEIDQLSTKALPSVMQKVLKLVRHDEFKD